MKGPVLLTSQVHRQPQRRITTRVGSALVATAAVVGLGLAPVGSAQANESFEVVDTINVPFTSEMVVLGDYGYVANTGVVYILDLTTNEVDASINDGSINGPDGAAVIGTNVYFASQNNDKLIIVDTISRTINSLNTNTGVGASTCDKPSQLRVVNSTRLIANCQTSGSVQIYDVTGPTIAGSVTTGTQPRGMSVNNGIVYVPNSGSNTMTVVDAAVTPPVKVGANVTVGAKPEFTAYADGKVYVANYDGDTVSIVDAATRTRVVPDVSVGEEPQGVATCGDYVLTANRRSGTTTPISIQADSASAAISVAPVGKVTHVIGAYGGYSYLLNFLVPSVAVVDCRSLTVVATITPSGYPSKITFGSGFAYITTTGGSGKVTVISIPEQVSPSDHVTGGTFADFQFFLPDGRECTSISPVRVQVGAMYHLPGVDAECQTMPEATVAGWTIPVPPGSTAYGSPSSPFPPGLSVRVVDSQRFTLVPKEPVLQIDYDANVADTEACSQTKTPHSSNRGRVEHVWVPRKDFAMARAADSASCVPDGHSLVAWSTTGDGTGDSYAPGAVLPADWDSDATNTRRLYAVWGSAN